MSALNPIILEEYKTTELPKDALSEEQARRIWERYRQQIAVEFPSPRTGGRWSLKSEGWVGYVPVEPELMLELRPKIPIANLFGMLEYAYDFVFDPDSKSFEVLKGLVSCGSLEEFYSTLATILAEMVLRRERRGLYRAYRLQAGPLNRLSGRVDFTRHTSRPWDARLFCRYEEFEFDVEDNRILTWTLHNMVHSSLCSEAALPIVRRAYHHMARVTSLTPVSAEDCMGRLYNRLNEDYRPMHALCRFFLEHSGPVRAANGHKMVPFLVDMEQLYESFVAGWLDRYLKQHRSINYELQKQKSFTVGRNDEVKFRIDLVLKDRNDGAVRYVMDTKYKAGSHQLQPADIAQVATYALAMNCSEAVLIYPTEEVRPFEGVIGDRVRVRVIPFSIQGNIRQAGERFVNQLLEIELSPPRV